MARGINKVILIGNLGRDPETRYTQSGSPVTRFSLATTESWRDRSTNEQQERTEWHNVVCFARLAEITGEYLRKGSKCYIEGSLRTSSWEKDGQTRYRTEVIAREMQMLDSRGAVPGGSSPSYDAPPPRSGNMSNPPPPPGPANGGQDAGSSDVAGNSDDADTLDDFEDDIPF